MIGGAALIFFAYIGFDAVSTAAEESAFPQRDLPIGIVMSLIICTVIYILVAGLLTGILPYTRLNVSSPVSYALLQIGHRFAAASIGRRHCRINNGDAGDVLWADPGFPRHVTRSIDSGFFLQNSQGYPHTGSDYFALWDFNLYSFRAGAY